MKKINYKPILKFILYILIISTLQAIINLIITLPNTINTVISLTSVCLYIFINNIKIGKTLTDKAYKVGFINGISTILILLILNIITLNFKFTLSTLIYYFIISINVRI